MSTNLSGFGVQLALSAGWVSCATMAILNAEQNSVADGLSLNTPLH